MAFPPSQLEEADDEFFDKLVDDDEFGVTPTAVTSVVGSSGMDGGSDSDEVRAFANLSMDEVPTVSEDTTSGGGIGVSAEEEKKSQDGVVALSSDDKTEKESLDQEESVSHVGSTSAVFHNNFETNDVPNMAEVSLDTSTSNSGSKSACIKEFQWSSFHADDTGESGFGSDFFAGPVDNSVGTHADIGNNTVVDSNHSAEPFAEIGNNAPVDSNHRSGTLENRVYDTTSSISSKQTNDVKTYTSGSEQTINEQDAYVAQFLEYPGWKYDATYGWYPDPAVNTQVNYEDTAQATRIDVVSTQCSEASFLQQTTQSVGGTLAEDCTTGSVSIWNQASQGTIESPPWMVFDPQYPEWYYHTIKGEWCSLASYYAQLESYTQAGQSGSSTQAGQSGSYTQAGQSESSTQAAQSESYSQAARSIPATEDHIVQNGNAFVIGFTPVRDQETINDHGKVETYGSQGNRNDAHGGDRAGNYVQQNTNIWQPKTMVKSNSLASYTENQHSKSLYDSRVSSSNSLDQQISFKPILTASYEQHQTGRSYGGNEGVGAFRSFVPTDNFSHQMNQPMVEQNNQMTASHGFYGNHNTGRYSQQTFPSGTQTSYTPHDGRSPHGRPPHALVTFGFGGKLVVVKDRCALGSSTVYASKDCIGGSISVFDLMDAVTNKNGASNIDFGGSGYFRTLCHQSFPGPLVGGNSGNKELNTWIDERITECASLNMEYRMENF